MTKRDFFILIIKLFGLYTVVASLFSTLPGALSYLLMDAGIDDILLISFAVLLTIGLFVLLIFKSAAVVRLLKLDKGFDDDKIELGQIGAEDVVKLGTFIVGGLLFLENLPGFLSQTIFAFKSDIAGMVLNPFDKIRWAIHGMNSVIGYLLLTNYRYVVKWFVKMD